MKVLISAWLERLRTSYWFVPTLMALSATGLSFLTVHIDTLIKAKWVRSTGWIWAGGAEGARHVLATIAGSTITVTGVVFSVTIVALTLASSQFGPRLLRNFMDDHGTQTVLGIFVSTFLYCLLVLRTIRGTDETTFVPYLSVTCGIVFAVLSVGFLIYFIHHIPSSILAENLIARVANELQEGIDRLYPEKAGMEKPVRGRPNELPARFDLETKSLVAQKSHGFVQVIAAEDLLKLATENDLIIRLAVRPGEFVAEQMLLAEAWPGAKANDQLMAQIREAFYFGRQRTPSQDVEYCIDQLVEVAVRALSPGINDPFTALSCIDWLGAGLIRLAGRKIPASTRYDDKQNLRLITRGSTFAGCADTALNKIRQYGSKSIAVVLGLLATVARVVAHAPRKEDRDVLLAHARKIRDDGIAQALDAADKEEIEKRFRWVESNAKKAE